MQTRWTITELGSLLLISYYVFSASCSSVERHPLLTFYQAPLKHDSTARGWARRRAPQNEMSLLSPKHFSAPAPQLCSQCLFKGSAFWETEMMASFPPPIFKQQVMSLSKRCICLPRLQLRDVWSCFCTQAQSVPAHSPAQPVRPAHWLNVVPPVLQRHSITASATQPNFHPWLFLSC